MRWLRTRLNAGTYSFNAGAGASTGSGNDGRPVDAELGCAVRAKERRQAPAHDSRCEHDVESLLFPDR
jgi:hypothetical protein